MERDRFRAPFFFRQVHTQVGDGSNTYFLEDKWVGDSSLCSKFPNLYRLSSMKSHSIVDVLNHGGSSLSFSLGFRRQLTNRETTEVINLLSLIGDCQFREGRRVEKPPKKRPARKSLSRV